MLLKTRLINQIVSGFSLFVVMTAVSANLPAEEFIFCHENVLGTSLELRVHTADKEVALKIEALALEELDRLNAIFSQYVASSEFSRLCNLPVGQSMEVSSELYEVLASCQEWTRLSGGAFNPAVEKLIQCWKRTTSNGSLPTQPELNAISAQMDNQHWHLMPSSNRITRTSDVPLTLNAIAKGTILDLVCNRLFAKFDNLDGVTINIGGDIRIAGQIAQRVSIADPKADAIGAAPLLTLTLYNGAIATSGSSERGFHVGDQKFSHILDPRTGQPVKHVVSATVIADDGETADVLATICNVLSPEASLKLVNSLPGIECLIVDDQGKIYQSNEWPSVNEGSEETGRQQLVLTQNVQQVKQTEEAKAKVTPHEFAIEFEINKAGEGNRYRRPYVAVWVEDKDDFPVKTLSLFIMSDNPGPRWHRDLRRWYRNDEVRQLADPKKLIGTISKPTRNPGTYKVAWDGTDDSGELLKDGKYVLYIEAAREHGTYQLMKLPFELGNKSFEEKMAGNVEIKSASVTYKKK